MSLHRYAKRRDESEPAIIKELRAVGADVFPLDRPCDLLVGYRGKNFLLECKNMGAVVMTKGSAQAEWWDKPWRGDRKVVTNGAEALWAIGAVARTLDPNSVGENFADGAQILAPLAEEEDRK